MEKEHDRRMPNRVSQNRTSSVAAINDATGLLERAGNREPHHENPPSEHAAGTGLGSRSGWGLFHILRDTVHRVRGRVLLVSLAVPDYRPHVSSTHGDYCQVVTAATGGDGRFFAPPDLG